MWHDVKVAVRGFRKHPAWAAAVVATLALGIGATSAMFMLVHAVMVEALPWREPASLVIAGGQRTRETASAFPMGYLDVEALGGARDMFESVAGVTNPRSFNLSAAGEVEHIDGEMVGEAYFRTLGVGTAAGRTFTADEARPPGAARVAVLSHALWMRRYAGRADAVGQVIQLNEAPYVIVGVAAPGFTGLSERAQVWLPLGMAHAVYGAHYTELRQFRWLYAVARLRDGVDAAAASKSVARLSEALASEFPVENKDFAMTVTPITESYLGGLRRPVLSLLAAAVFVLLIACTNVANLSLVRALARQHEVALRVALGAPLRQLARQAVVENVLLVFVGTVLGLVLAHWSARAVVASGLLALPAGIAPRLNVIVVVTTLVTCLTSAVAFASAPALLAARRAAARGLADGRRGATAGRTRGRVQRLLVVGETALAIALLAGAGLMVRGFQRFVETDLGFARDSLVTMRLDLTADRYKQNENVLPLVRHVLERASSLPGVVSAAVEGPGYPGGGWYQIGLLRDGTGSGDDGLSARRHHVSPGYLATLGIPLLRGRDFTSADVPGGQRVAIVGERLARLAWPGQDAVGQRLRVEGSNTELRVIGVSGDVEHGGLQADDTPQADIYLSAFQSPPRSPSLLTLFVRTARGAPSLLESMSDAVREMDPSLPLFDVQTMEARLAGQTTTARLLIAIMGTFAVLGLVLAAVGIYGVVAFGVAQRGREIAVHMALGATPADIMRRVVREGLGPVLLGVGCGALVVVGLTRFLMSLLYGLNPLDPATLTGTTLLLLTVAALASWLPARRASRVQPNDVLKAD